MINYRDLQGTLPLLQERGYQKSKRNCALAAPYLLFNQRTIVFSLRHPVVEEDYLPKFQRKGGVT